MGMLLEETLNKLHRAFRLGITATPDTLTARRSFWFYIYSQPLHTSVFRP
jgi:hypothetical protein